MAALYLKEDRTTGQLILESRLLPRLLGALGNLGWLIVLVLFFGLPRLFGGRIDIETLIILLIIVLFSLLPALRAFFGTTVKLDSASRTLSRTTSLVFFPVRSSALVFNDLANIEVQYYRQSSGRSSHNAFRVNAMDKTGNRIPLNWDGQRDEMFALAQRISAMTGAPVLDHTAKPVSTLDQVIEMTKNLGLPLPQETGSTPEPPTTTLQEPSAEQTYDASQSGEEPTVVPATALGEESPISTHEDLRSLSIGELEQRVASDPMDSDARYTLARKYHTRGQLERAIEMYQATLQIETSNAEAQNDLGIALQQRGKRAEAEAAYRRAIALDPFSFNAHLNLALLLRAMNRATEASQEFFQARQNARGDAETRTAEAASAGGKVEPQLSTK